MQSSAALFALLERYETKSIYSSGMRAIQCLQILMFCALLAEWLIPLLRKNHVNVEGTIIFTHNQTWSVDINSVIHINTIMSISMIQQIKYDQIDHYIMCFEPACYWLTPLMMWQNYSKALVGKGSHDNNHLFEKRD